MRDFSYSYAAVDKISIDKARRASRGTSAIAELPIHEANIKVTKVQAEKIKTINRGLHESKLKRRQLNLKQNVYIRTVNM